MELMNSPGIGCCSSTETLYCDLKHVASSTFCALSRSGARSGVISAGTSANAVEEGAEEEGACGDGSEGDEGCRCVE